VQQIQPLVSSTQLLLGAVEVALPGDERGVDIDLAHVVDNDRHPAALPVGQDVVEQRRLARAQEAGQHGDGQQFGGRGIGHKLMIMVFIYDSTPAPDERGRKVVWSGV
jgi:hypothetical protein